MSNELPASVISLEIRYQTHKELFLAAQGKQFDYGKWLLASLLAVHGGSLLAISQAGDAKVKLYQACGPLLIYGLAVTLVAGGLTWINFTAVANVYGHALKDLRFGLEPNPTPLKRFIVGLTFWVTPAVAIASLTLFVVAAVKAANVL
jgi:hypothetical protein